MGRHNSAYWIDHWPTSLQVLHIITQCDTHTHTHTAHNMRVFQAELGHRGFPARLRWSGDGDACTTVNTYLFTVHSSACSISLCFKVVCLYFMYCYGVITEMRRLCLQTVVPSGCAGNPVFMGSFALSGWVGSISELAVFCRTSKMHHLP